MNQIETLTKVENTNTKAIQQYTFTDIIYKSPAMSDLIKSRKNRQNQLCYTITGESEREKSYRPIIHNASNRKDAPFIAINCAAL